MNSPPICCLWGKIIHCMNITWNPIHIYVFRYHRKIKMHINDQDNPHFAKALPYEPIRIDHVHIYIDLPYELTPTTLSPPTHSGSDGVWIDERGGWPSSAPECVSTSMRASLFEDDAVEDVAVEDVSSPKSISSLSNACKQENKHNGACS